MPLFIITNSKGQTWIKLVPNWLHWITLTSQYGPNIDTIGD